MTIRHDRKVLDNLCALSQDISNRITTCERYDRESSKVSYDDLVCWFDCVSDAIQVINRNLEVRNERA